MIDNYNVIELLEVYETIDNSLSDIIADIKNNGIIGGTKLS